MSGIGGAGRGVAGSPEFGVFGDFGLWNRERTRCTPVIRLSAVLDGVWGGFRRKSVRMSLLGCGSLMLPKEEPLRRRSELRRRAPRRQTLAIVRRMPSSRPGKKPTRTAPTGNLSQWETVQLAVGVAPGFAEVVGTMVVEVEVDAEGTEA